MSSPIFRKNLAWVAEQTQTDPHVFTRNAKMPDPRILWIGCSDNPHSSLEIASSGKEGRLVHRNLGNQVSAQDANLLATLAYAIDGLQIERIVVCGHYGCRCLRHVLRGGTLGAADYWTSPIRSLFRQHRRQLDEIVSEEAQIQTLCELNVRMQVRNLAEHPLVEARLAVGSLKIDGAMWSARDGLLRDPGIAVARTLRISKKAIPSPSDRG
jgi:carbonic anhydrase